MLLLPRQLLLCSRSISTSSLRFFATATDGVKPLKLAIIGAGPSGFYSASRILSQLSPDSPQGQATEVHLYERLPTPHGLVRYGVAPDHPDVKNVQHKFDLLQSDPRFSFYGNVSVGSPPSSSQSQPPSLAHTPYQYPHSLSLPLSSLLPHYTHLLLSYGSSLSSPLPHVPGSSSSPAPLANVFPALAFVSWYNGHPAYAHLKPDLKNTKHVTIIGQGNVALDCARILLKSSPSTLDKTDIPEAVLAVLRESKVERVDVVGRRGPGQVAFTTKEFREMLNLEGVEFGGVEEGMVDDAVKEVGRIGGTEERMRKRLLGLMKKKNETSNKEEQGGEGKGRVFNLSFLQSPKSFNPSTSASSSSSSSSSSTSSPASLPSSNPSSSSSLPQPIKSVTFSLTTLLPPPISPASTPPHQPDQPPSVTLAQATGEEVEIETDMVIESVGYRSEPLGERVDGEELVPFDARRGKVRNIGGRVVDEDGMPIPNTYTSGWVSRGPIGVIASTMYDSYSTMDLLIADHLSSSSHPHPTPSSPPTPGARPMLSPNPLEGPPKEVLDAMKAGVVNYGEWKRLEGREKEEGLKRGKSAEKIVDVGEMLRVAKGEGS